jgi:signal transduction histidine kinase/CheY-like chemotaxis protein
LHCAWSNLPAASACGPVAFGRKDLSNLILQAAFYLLFAATLVGFIRRPGALTLDIVLMFGALAGLFAFQFVRQLLPGAEAAVGLIGLALLLAQPGLALRLTRHVSRLPGWVGPAMLTGYVIVLAALLTLGDEQPAIVLVAVAYFVLGDGLAAFLLAREAGRRIGFARLRLSLAGGALVLTALTIVVAIVGGSVGAALTRVVALLAALAFLLAFAPPRWMRRLGQQAVAYRFLLDLSRIEPGTGAARQWQLLVDAAVGLTSAVGAEVRLSTEPEQGPLATAGLSNGTASHITRILFGDEAHPGELRLRTRGPALFAEDDVTLLTLLGAQTLAAAGREEILTERTRMSERIASANVELARASAAKSDFLAAMSHELRTPLNAIIGFSELLLTPPAPLGEAAVGEYAGHIHGAGLHLLELINDILDLSRVEAGRLELRHEQIDVALLLAETLGTVRPLAEAKGLALEAELPPSLMAEVDAARLRQVAYNLLSNAIKFTPVEGRVRVTLSVDQDTLCLSVSDTGPGIAAEDQQRIFAAFEQLAPDSAQGTGLGLALTQRLVEAHGGRIELTSVAGEGSRFDVSIPLRRANQAEASPVEPDLGSGPLVLVVEDDAAAAELLQLQLRQAGYCTALAADGESGLQAAQQLAPAAILLDILLPGLDGWEVLRRLRATPLTSGIPVMVITIVDNAALGLALGAVDYFVKPVSRETLLGALARFTLTSKVRERTVTVLTIDDDPTALQVYRESLTPEGFRVIEAASGEEGLAQARSGSVDAIVLDILLPDLDGFEVAAQLKADPDTSEIPILVVTGHALSDEEKARLNEHALAVLAKGDEALSGLRGWLEQIPARHAT